MEPVVESQNEIKQTWSLKEDMGNGIWVYRDVLPKDLDIINRLESILGASNNLIITFICKYAFNFYTNCHLHDSIILQKKVFYIEIQQK